MTEEGRQRLKEGGIEGAYLGPDGHIHIPGKRVTLYSEPSPTKEEMEKVNCKGEVCTRVHEASVCKNLIVELKSFFCSFVCF